MCSAPATHFSSAVVCVPRLSPLHFFCDLMADLKGHCQFSQEPRASLFRNLKVRTQFGAVQHMWGKGNVHGKRRTEAWGFRQKSQVAKTRFLSDGRGLKEICSLWCLSGGWHCPHPLSLALCLPTGHCEKQITLDSEARLQDNSPSFWAHHFCVQLMM